MKFKINEIGWNCFNSQDLEKYFKKERFEWQYTPKSKQKKQSFRLPEPFMLYNRKKIVNPVLAFMDLVNNIIEAYHAPNSRRIKNPLNRVLNIQLNDENLIDGIYLLTPDMEMSSKRKLANNIKETISSAKVFLTDNLLIIEFDKGTESLSNIVSIAEFLLIMGPISNEWLRNVDDREVLNNGF